MFCSLFCNTRGYNIGMRIVDEFLARSGQGRCSDFKQTGEVIAYVLHLVYLTR